MSDDPAERARRWLAAALMALSCGVLTGWFLDISWLKSGLPGLMTMKANTAAGLMAGGIGLTLIGSRRRGLRTATVAVAGLLALVGVLTLVEYAAGLRLGIDELIVADPNTMSAPFNGRMSPATAIAFAASGASLVLLGLARRRVWVAIAHMLAAVPGMAALLALTGYAYNVNGPNRFGPYVTVALHTGIGLALLGAGIVLTRRQEGWQRAFMGHPIAMAALRRIALLSVTVPLLLGLLVVWGTRRGLYEANYAPALLAVGTAIVLVWLAFQSAHVLARAEAAVIAARTEAAERGRQLELALSSGCGVGTWDWDVVHDRVQADERFARLYGVDPADARVGTPITAYFGCIHPDDLEATRARIDEAVRTGAPFSAEYRLVQDGHVTWVQAQGRCALAADGSPVRFPGVSFDITERKASEGRQAALIALSDRLRDLTEPAAMAYEASCILGQTLGVGRVGYGLVDRVAETVVIERDWTAPGIRSLAGMLHFRDYGSYIENLKRGETVTLTDTTVDERTRATAAALLAVDARAFVNLPLIEQGGLVAVLFVTSSEPRAWSAADLTLLNEVAERVRVASERVRAESARWQSDAQFRVFAQAIPNHVWGGQPDGHLDWFNDRAYAYTGAARGSLDGLSGWEKLIHPEDVAQAGAAWGRSLASGEVYETEFRVRRADGVYRWFLVRAEAVRSALGEIVRWVGTNTDVDDQRRQTMELAELNATLEAQVEARTASLRAAEDKLRQSMKMEAIGQLTGGLAHDFNNLLTGITGSLEFVSTRVAQGRVSEVERYVAAAQQAARRAAALTHRLLAFSRRQTLDPRAIDVNRLVAGMEDLVRRTAGPAIAVEVRAGEGLWHSLIDPPQLENALLNLCINARDAMQDGGCMTITTENRWLEADAARECDLPAGEYVTLSVADTGTGMTPEVIARAFDPFFTTKPLGQGTGLGLSMIYGFVRQSGGQVRISSEPGRGTTVCLYLPRHQGASDEMEVVQGVAARPRATEGQTVLVIDDESTVRMLVTEVLEDLGYATIEAGDGPAGLQVLRSGARVDLLVTDVGLPGGMNGRQVADAARVERPGLKVLFITGFAEQAVLSSGHLEHGMQVLTKPFAMDVLAGRICELTRVR